MRIKKLFWLPFLAIATLALMAAACGDDEEEATTPTSVATAAPNATLAAPPTEEAQATRTTAPTAQATSAPAAETVEIAAVPRVKFDKDTITVKAGSQVTLKFINDDTGVPHNWAAYTDSSAEELIPGAITETCSGPCEEEITFTAPSEPGEYFFRCDIHPVAMTGTLVVE